LAGAGVETSEDRMTHQILLVASGYGLPGVVR
jgi:hypothetical protein